MAIQVICETIGHGIPGVRQKKDGWTIQQRGLAAQNTGETPRKIGLEAAKMVTPTKTEVSPTSY